MPPPEIPPPIPSAPTPPPLPRKSSARIWIGLGITLGLILAVGAAILSNQLVRLAEHKLENRQQALNEFETSAQATRANLAKSVKSGQAINSTEVLGELRNAAGKAAQQLEGGDADVARAISNYLAKLQEQMRDYDRALDELTAAKVFNFELSSREAFEPQRKIVNAFLASNARLTTTTTSGDAMIRAELEAAKVSSGRLEATLKGFNRTQAVSLPVRLQIRRLDQTLGNSALAALDLLEKDWGKWERDPKSGQLRFQNPKTTADFNQLIQTIQNASAEQAKAQKELVEKMQNNPTR